MLKNDNPEQNNNDDKMIMVVLMEKIPSENDKCMMQKKGWITKGLLKLSKTQFLIVEVKRWCKCLRNVGWLYEATSRVGNENVMEPTQPFAVAHNLQFSPLWLWTINFIWLFDISLLVE